MKNREDFKITVSGGMGSGKTWLCSRLSSLCADAGLPLTVIDADRVSAGILEDRSSSLFRDIQAKMLAYFGKEIERAEGGINRRRLSDIIFFDEEALRYHNSVLDPVLLSAIDDQIKSSGCSVLLDWALAVEKDALGLTDYNLLLLDCSEETRLRRVAGGDLPYNQFGQSFLPQPGFRQKWEAAKRVQEEKGRGMLLTLDTTSTPPDEDLLSLLKDFRAGNQESRAKRHSNARPVSGTQSASL